MSDSGLAVALSVVAIVVSFIAAGFTGWQAVTEHLARTRPRPAAFVLSPRESRFEPWVLTNSGGSIASDIELTIRYLIPPEKEPFTAKVTGPLLPDGSVQVPNTADRSLPTGLFVAAGDGRWRSAKDGEKGEPVLERRARVTWRNYRGDRRTGWIVLW